MNNEKPVKTNSSDGWVRTCAAVLPFLIFYAVFEIVAAVLQLIWQSVISQTGNDTEWSWLVNNIPWVTAMMTAISMTVALLFVLRTAVGEIRSFSDNWNRYSMENPTDPANAGTQHLSSAEARLRRWNPAVGLMFFLVGLCLYLGMNTLFSMTGFAAYTGTTGQENVSLTWGVAVYGILTPLIEEIVFRGAVFARMVRLFNFDKEQDSAGSTAPRQTMSRRSAALHRYSIWQSRRRTLLGAMLFSSILFALWHNNLPQGILGFCVGLVLSGMYAWSGSFALPVILHGLLNIFGLVLSATGVYNSLCTPAWCAGFLIVAAAGAVSLYHYCK